MARALQTLLLAKKGHLHPIFSSIEEWLGRNTDEYYAVLTRVGQGSWNPTNDALPWIRFCLKAHYQQAGTMTRRFDEYDDLFGIIGDIIEKHELNERMSLPLFDCALGLRMTNARYQKDADVSQYVAGRDLKQLADLGLITPHGEKRGRHYVANDTLNAARSKVRRTKKVDDPYDLVAERASGPTPPGL
jgi:Fic family protein